MRLVVRCKACVGCFVTAQGNSAPIDPETESFLPATGVTVTYYSQMCAQSNVAPLGSKYHHHNHNLILGHMGE